MIPHVRKKDSAIVKVLVLLLTLLTGGDLLDLVCLTSGFVGCFFLADSFFPVVLVLLVAGMIPMGDYLRRILIMSGSRGRRLSRLCMKITMAMVDKQAPVV